MILSEWVDVLKISNIVKTEKEVIDLIEKYIDTAHKLSKTVYQLERDLF